MKEEILKINKQTEYIKETIEELQELEDIDYDDDIEVESDEDDGSPYNDEHYNTSNEEFLL